MSFQLMPDEPLRKSLRRIVRKQIDGTLKNLRAAKGKTRDEAIHEARKAFKRARAVLRSVRPRIGESTYQKANRCLRDAGRPLAEIRDAKVLIDGIDKLAEQFQERVAGRTFEEARGALVANARAVRKQVLSRQRAFSQVKKALRSIRPSLKKWTDVPNKWSSLGAGLKDTYRRASDAFAAAATAPESETLHEWRKQVKYLRYQLKLLRPIWPERIEQLAHEADIMGELLGNDHDLTLLQQMLTADPEQFGDAGDVELLLALIEHRQAQLREEALKLGQRFFVESPSEFTRQFKEYWQAWRDELPSAQPVLPAAIA